MLHRLRGGAVPSQVLCEALPVPLPASHESNPSAAVIPAPRVRAPLDVSERGDSRPGPLPPGMDPEIALSASRNHRLQEVGAGARAHQTHVVVNIPEMLHNV